MCEGIALIKFVQLSKEIFPNLSPILILHPLFVKNVDHSQSSFFTQFFLAI